MSVPYNKDCEQDQDHEFWRMRETGLLDNGHYYSGSSRSSACSGEVLTSMKYHQQRFLGSIKGP